GALASLAGLPKTSDTVIQRFGATVRLAPDAIDVTSLEVTVPTIGTLTGAGTIAPNGALDFRMIAKIQAGSIAPKTGGIANVGAFEQRNGLRSGVGGTTADPTFAPDVAGVGTNVKNSLADAAKDPQTLGRAVEALGSLFDRKK